MLFALIDYAQYSLWMGRYSAKSMERRGAFKVDAESVRVLEQAQDGDLIFTHPMNSFVAWAIMYVTDGGPWSHVGNLTKEGTVTFAQQSVPTRRRLLSPVMRQYGAVGDRPGNVFLAFGVE
jgi:hypothetical protein